MPHFGTRWIEKDQRRVEEEAKRRAQRLNSLHDKQREVYEQRQRSEQYREKLPSILAITFCLCALIVCSLIEPKTALQGALLTLLALILCCCISLGTSEMFLGRVTDSGFNDCPPLKPYGCFRLCWSCLLNDNGTLSPLHAYGKFAWRSTLLCMLIITLRLCRSGLWFDSCIMWPLAFCSTYLIFHLSPDCWAKFFPAEEIVEVTPTNPWMIAEDRRRRRKRLARQRSAYRTVLEKTITFEGRVLSGRGRPCVCSWPGKYESAWDALVESCQKGKTSAAVVFLPQGTKFFGSHDPIPKSEKLEGKCWCFPLYGEEKPWGCRWWTHWIVNIKKAVQYGAELQVYYFRNAKGKGKVKGFSTAGQEHLRREAVLDKRDEFERSECFQKALEAGLTRLSQDECDDGSSQYSREYDWLFLSWLSEEERDFLKESEGLGNSQKAEVAWLERQGYSYTEMEVDSINFFEENETSLPNASEIEMKEFRISVA